MEDYHDMYGAKPNQIWKLAESVSIVEATLLMLDIEPQGVSAYVENYDADKQPLRYLAARNAVTSALRESTVKGNWVWIRIATSPEGVTIWDEVSVDVEKSTVQLDSLRTWLLKKSYTCETFPLPAFKKDASFLNPQNARYAPKLAAAVEAWEAFDESDTSPGTPKQKLERWLRLNAARFNFTNEDGAPQENVIKDLAKVANWATKGGAPKQADAELEADDIPF